MAELFDRIREAVEAGRYVLTDHADEQLRARSLREWYIVGGLAQATLLIEDNAAFPHPKIEVEQILPDGTPVKAVWSWHGYNQTARLVTVHYFDE